MTHDPDRPAQDRIAAEKAIWQRRVRDHLLRAFADLGQLKHPPRKVDLAAYMLEVVAEQTIDIDLLTLIGPFARKLPEAYEARGRDARIVQRFKNRRHVWKAGRGRPLEPMPGEHGAEGAEAQPSGDQMTDEPAASSDTPEDDLARKQREQRQALMRAFAGTKAEWQADLRLRFRAFMLDYCDRNHPPQLVEIAQFLLELVAEYTDDHDLLDLILSFAERLPHELEARHDDGRIAMEFLRVANAHRRYGQNGKPRTGELDPE